MANDRVFLKCNTCGGWKMLLKHSPLTGPVTRSDSGILVWLDTHANCHPNRYDLDLQGNPGFSLHTENSIELDVNKQNLKGIVNEADQIK